MTFGASVGIRMLASGMYRCDAQNGNASRSASLTVSVLCEY